MIRRGCRRLWVWLWRPWTAKARYTRLLQCGTLRPADTTSKHRGWF
jgi:hypothetical protein